MERDIVLVEIEREGLDAPTLARRIAEHGVLVMALVPRRLRCRAHHDITAENVSRVAAAFASALGN